MLTSTYNISPSYHTSCISVSFTQKCSIYDKKTSQMVEVVFVASFNIIKHDFKN